MFSSANYLILPLIASAAVALDWLFGEPKRYHPLVGFGYLAAQLERRLNPQHRQTSTTQYYAGALGLTLLILPFFGLAYWLCELPYLGYVIHTLLLYFALGNKSLHQHARAVSNALHRDDRATAILATSYMVSRDSSAIEPVPATVESVLENGNDGVFGAIFWFLVAGGAGALAFRLINTMDAMWGYKNQRYYYFGWAAARLDDVMNYLPARITALTYALLGNTRSAIHCWKTQAPLWDSPNAGPVMSAGAGALHVKLGGAASYHGEWHARPILGAGDPPEMNDIERALQLVRHGVYLWLIVALFAEVIVYA
jgi:adenosylcobinamide-phosphate synthase